MKCAFSPLVAAVLMAGSQAFTPFPQTILSVSVYTQSATSISMGLFDFFSEEARKEREVRREREIAEQEEIQREILELRRNPEKMDEYKARTVKRRQAISNGKDPSSVKGMDDWEELDDFLKTYFYVNNTF